MAATVVIDERFKGPPDSANGGYASALAAEEIDGPAEVTLHSPPPLGKPLRREATEDGYVLLDGETVIAESHAARVETDIPEPVSLEEAARASSNYPWREGHPYPTCFVCGPERRAGDGLVIFPGPVESRQLYAAPWTPEAGLAEGDGQVRPEFVWSALDCPSGIVTDLFEDAGRVILGRIAVDIKRPVMAGQDHVVQAWTIGRDGRKLHTASALFTADGDLCAAARAVWIEVMES